MKRRSLVFQLAVGQQLLAVALIVGFSTLAYWLSARALERQETDLLRNTAAQVAQGLEREWREETDLVRAAHDALNEETPPGVQVDVFDPAGRRVASTQPLVAGAPPAAGRAGMRHTVVTMTGGARVDVSIPTQVRTRALSALALALALAGIPLLLLATLASRALSLRALAPLSRMAEEARDGARQGRPRALGHAADPTEIAELATAFNQLLARLDALLEAERHFAGDAAHELRTPLTVLSGEIEYALADPAVSGRQRDTLRRAEGQVRTLIDLVEALLLLRQVGDDRASAGATFAPVDLVEMTRGAVAAALEHLPQRAGDIAVEAEEELLVRGDARLLAAGVGNLLSNALKFTAAGQPVRVAVRGAADGAHVVVEDGGPGVPAAERGRIFDPFYRGAEARAEREGTGLGLPILQRVARAHGGEVTVAASALGGARFDLRLPAWRAEPRS